MCSINLFPLSLIFMLSVTMHLCQSKAVLSSEKEGYSEFGTTEYLEVGLTNDHREGFNDVTNTVTEATEVADEIYMETSEATRSMNDSFLKDGGNATNSALNLTATQTELSNFFPEINAENVTADTNATDRMDVVPLTTTDTSVQTETNQFGEVTFNLSAFVDYGASFNLSTDVKIEGSNDTILKESLLGNIFVDSYIGTAGKNNTFLQEEFLGNISIGTAEKNNTVLQEEFLGNISVGNAEKNNTILQEEWFGNVSVGTAEKNNTVLQEEWFGNVSVGTAEKNNTVLQEEWFGNVSVGTAEKNNTVLQEEWFGNVSVGTAEKNNTVLQEEWFGNVSVGTAEKNNTVRQEEWFGNISVGTAEKNNTVLQEEWFGNISVGTAEKNNTVLQEEWFGNISVGTAEKNNTVLQEEWFGNVSVGTAEKNNTVLQEGLLGNISIGTAEKNNTVLQEGLLGNISVVVSHILNGSHNSPLVSAWSDVAYDNQEEEEDEGEEEEEEEEVEGKEERKKKKSTSDVLGNGIEERDPGCGISRHGHHSRKKRVVGGTRTVYGQLPWLVTLRFRGSHKFLDHTGYNHLCGATLIDPRWLLTSAHCFHSGNLSNKTFWYAVLGENSLSVPEETRKQVEIDKIIVHEHFSYPDNMKHDVALLKISEPITETEYIKFICLDREELIFPGEICTVAGWGLHSYEGNGSAYPFQTTLTVISQSQCEEKVKHLDGDSSSIYDYSEATFCAHSDKGNDTCHGDSGGPFQCYRNGRWYLTGVTHAGYKCGEVPGVYARVGFFINWIAENMRNN